MTVKADAHFVDCDLATGSGAWNNEPPLSGGVSYPTLHELDASEIPAKPSEPADTALVTPTSIVDKTGWEAIPTSATGHYSIDADIDLTGSTKIHVFFAGVIEGNGYTISNYTNTGFPGTNLIGIFRFLDSGAEIRNLNFDNITISGGSHAGVFAGILEDAANIKLSDISISNATLNCDEDGGILLGNGDENTYSPAGAVNIWRCSADSCTVNSVSANSGDGNSGLISTIDCKAGASVNVVDCSVTNCQMNCATSAGLFYELSGDFSGTTSYIHSCTASATWDVDDVNGTEGVGGLVYAPDDNVKIVSCSSVVSIDSTDHTTQSMDNVGGFVGLLQGNNVSIIDCNSSGTIAFGLGNDIGGFCGFAPLGAFTMTRCYSTVDITCPIDSSGVETQFRVGGFIGQINAANENADWDYQQFLINRCWSSGDITIVDTQSTTEDIGGFIGLVKVDEGSIPGSGTDYIIQDCYSWGSVQGGLNIDGASGFIASTEDNLNAITIDNCYCAQTNVRTGSGLSDQICSTTLQTGSCNSFIGTEIGTYAATITNSFYDAETSGAGGSLGDGNTTVWMMTKTNYQTAGWAFSTADGVKDDINSIWTIASPSATTGLQYRASAYPQNWEHLEGQEVQLLLDGTHLDDFTYVITNGVPVAQ